jgi:beta-N-acetylhexosaminidase
MRLQDRVAQLILMPCYGEDPATKSDDYKQFRHWVHGEHIGGFIVANRVVNGQVRNAQPYAMAVFLNRMQRLSRIPLVVGSDFERGASMRVAGTVKFPYNMAFGAARDIDDARFEGAETAREARALGVQWVYAPDADVNNNPDNPIINTRSYGENPQEVAQMVSAYIEGAHSDPKTRILVTAKHFPGHGDTSTDSHLGLARLDVPLARIESVELVPFRAAVAHGVDAVMTAHMAVPALEPQNIPATVSSNILTGVLRNELGFRGIIVTDAMNMRGLAAEFSQGEAAVRAIEAGADMLLMPSDPETVIRAVVAAVRSHRITLRRLDESVLRVLGAKVRLGLAYRRTVDIDRIADTLDNPEAEQVAQRVADRALTLVRNDKDQIPLRDAPHSCLIVLREGAYSQQGRQLVRQVSRRAPAMKIRVLDPDAPDAELNDTVQMAAGCTAAIVAAFDTVGAYRGTVALPGGYPNMLAAMTAGKTPVTLIAFGNPYLLRSFPNVAAYLATFSTVSGSEISVAKALFGEIPITGHMPVSIPGFAKYGDGIQLTLAAP